MPTSIVTSNAQTTIPREVRDALGIGPGDEISYRIEGDCVILKRKVTLDQLMARFDPAKHRRDAEFDDVAAGRETL